MNRIRVTDGGRRRHRRDIRTAQWAVDEAVIRDLPVRLVHVIVPGSEAVRLEEDAEIVLRTAAGLATRVCAT